MVLATSAGAQEPASDTGGAEIVVTGHRPMRVDAKILRAAQARFAEDRIELSPQGVLQFELWRGNKRVRADGVKLALMDAAGREIPVTIDGNGRIAFAPVPKGRWFLTAPAQASDLSLRPIILSSGTRIDDRRLGDLRLQCRVMVSMAKAKASLLAMPLIGMFDAIGGCASKRFGFYHRTEQSLAGAVAVAPGGTPKVLPMSATRDAYLPPLSDRTMDNETRIRTTYQ
ncbi:hypothetical protein QLH51_16840 [Sphingomonas sp. 2R-10]|uniref:hypothetical protein n=1 Tax=Sphingomonas sp. 2R-10 TaxID=3045148 RepID=UPI000F7A6654|nr:hypothetical protein [Sphingomonas sp. 2R-10]MDJ0278465.1 hypothetical protein [Sphingomonas sp. 2R-10]